MSIDLGSFETSSDGEWLEILHPVTGVPLDGMAICLVGKDSDEYRKAQRAVTQRRLKSRSKASRVDAEQIEHEAIDVLVRCTKEWKGVLVDGEELACEPANVRKVYTDYPWLREQVDDFVDDRGNFMKA